VGGTHRCRRLPPRSLTKLVDWSIGICVLAGRGTSV
jgi:hypothetical protein